MSMNFLGKSLVLINMALAGVMLSWALVLYTHPVDWGRKEASKAWSEPPASKKEDFVQERLASELDKRIAALQQEVDGRPRAEANLLLAQKRLADVETVMAQNHLRYNKELARLWDGAGELKIHELKYDDATGTLVLEPKGLPAHHSEVKYEGGGVVIVKPAVDENNNPILDETKAVGYPAFQEKELADVKYSFMTYYDKLMKVLDDMQASSEKIKDLLAKEEVVTVRLSGKKDEKGKILTPGYYHLVELEATAQRRLKDELEYIQPLWVRELVNAQLLLERRRGLEYRLAELGEKPAAQK